MSYGSVQCSANMAYSAQTTQQQIEQNSGLENLSFLGKQLNDELPVVIKIILKGCGFDNKFSISKINKGVISIIENFMSETPDYADSILKGTTYENIKPFKLLPAHEILILSLPDYIQTEKKNKKNKNSKSQDELKQILVQKLQHYAENSGIEFGWSIDLISNFRRQVSNFQLHLKNHWISDNQTSQIEDQAFIEKEFEVDENLQVVRTNKQQNLDILNILSI